EQREEPGAAAAFRGPGDGHELEQRNGGEQLERRHGDALRMEEMAGRIVRHVKIERGTRYRAFYRVPREQLRDVADASTEPLAAGIAQKMSVLFHEGATASAVHDDRFIVIADGIHVRAGHRTRFVE